MNIVDISSKLRKKPGSFTRFESMLWIFRHFQQVIWNLSHIVHPFYQLQKKYNFTQKQAKKAKKLQEIHHKSFEKLLKLLVTNPFLSRFQQSFYITDRCINIKTTLHIVLSPGRKAQNRQIWKPVGCKSEIPKSLRHILNHVV